MAECEGVDAFAASGRLPDHFFASLTELHATYDEYVARQIAAAGLRISCRVACSRCCHQAVHGVYSFEIVNLYRRLRMREDCRAVHDAFADYADRFQETVEQIGESGESDPVQGAIEAFAAAAMPCPFLLDDRCRVYAERPLACRMYHGLAEPVHCTTALGENVNIEMPAAVGAVLWSLSDRIAYPFPTLLAQGMVTFAGRRDFQPWDSATP